jgi:mRNA interferase RelE/StbE
LHAIPRDIALRILARLTELETDPYGFNTTALAGDPTRRRLRVGDYRTVCTLDHGQLTIWIVQVGHRSTTYRRP